MQKKQKSIGLVWFTNDLRTRDQEALFRASEQCDRVLGIYCLDPRQFGTTQFGFPKTGAFRAKFFLESVSELGQNLASLGIPLLIRESKPESVIPQVCQQLSVSDLYFTQAITSEEQIVQQDRQRALPAEVSLHSFHTDFLVHPEDLPFPLDDLPEVFTSFRKAVEKKDPHSPRSARPSKTGFFTAGSTLGHLAPIITARYFSCTGRSSIGLSL